MRRGNIKSGLPDVSRAEATEGLAAMRGGLTVIERIVSGGQASPPGFWYDQAWDEWVMVIAGAAELEFENPAAEERLEAGDWLLIPARLRHRVRSTEDGTIWLAVHAGTAEAMEAGGLAEKREKTAAAVPAPAADKGKGKGDGVKDKGHGAVGEILAMTDAARKARRGW